jgi:pyruvate/2-oxoglutarate dehydrogenase complex dihydrolipoamide acyltransferase (E2) component
MILLMMMMTTYFQSIDEIAVEFSSLQKSALAGTIKENQLKGGTFTLSNIGIIYINVCMYACAYIYLYLHISIYIYTYRYSNT